MDQRLERILPRVQKPARYTGGEYNQIIKDKAEVNLRMAFCFPDIYEIGMSNIGMRILYHVMNRMPGVWCERVFAPWGDMEQEMRAAGIPLYALESGDPVSEFDVLGFSIGYEMAYPAVLNMLDLAGIPLRSADRPELVPLVFAGGTSCCNPEPMAPFLDLMVIGEGEEVNCELLELFRTARDAGWDKQRFLIAAAQIPGIYVPSLYEPHYHEDGTLSDITPSHGAPKRVTKRIIEDLDACDYPTDPIVPSTEIVHDRVNLELFRGCIRGCRFCQAGFIYRPFREKNAGTLNQNGRCLCESTGYDEISLSSLSTSDYSQLEGLLEEMLPWTEKEKVNLSLPSLRIDNFSPSLMEKITRVRKSGLTFAPEAGTQRLRDVINKNVTEEEVLSTCRTAFEGGYTSVKLYFMMGLPTETKEDIEGVVDLAQKVVDLFYSLPDKPKGKGVNVTISLACFVPKPFTPFQFEPQDTEEMLREKQRHMIGYNRSKKIRINYHESKTSFLEAVLARGDRRLCAVVEDAWKNGCKLDGWTEHFNYDAWMAAFEKNGIDGAFYANRTRSYDEVTPWDHLDFGVSKGFLVRENQKAHEDAPTPNCREKCSGCGANCLIGRSCF